MSIPIRGKFKLNVTYGAKGKLWKKGHKGIDLLGDTLIFATGNGTVSVVDYDKNGWGWYVSIIPDNKKSHREIFCHLKEGSIRVKKGSKVSQFTAIGTMGSTGNSTGVHLHYEVQKNGTAINAATYLGLPNKEGEYDSAEFEKKVNGFCTYPNGETHYYKNSKKHTGWLTYNNNQYYFDKNGVMCTSYIDGSKLGIKYRYHFDKNGVFIKREKLKK